MLLGSTTSYYQADGLGSVTTLSNSAGAIAASYTYDSFGNILANSGSIANSFRYTGRELDPETSLYYYRVRYYDSTTGRFFSEDPLSLSVGMNLYRYVDNNPQLFVDPFGMWKNTGKPADPGKNTIVCNGQGGVRIQFADYMELLPDRMECLGGCTRQHEEGHRRDALKQNPQVCKGAKDGIQVSASSIKEKSASEIVQYTHEIQCLNNKKKEDKCGKCKDLINGQLTEAGDQIKFWNLVLSTEK
jgi:RHS repeat-associated protein